MANKKINTCIAVFVIMLNMLFAASCNVRTNLVTDIAVASCNSVTDAIAEIDDNGYQLAIVNKMLCPVDSNFENRDVEIKNTFFDGLRVYAEIYTSNDEAVISNAFLYDSKNKYTANHIYENKNNTTVLIWDNYHGEKNVEMQLEITNDEMIISEFFQLNDCKTSVYEVEKNFEEFFLDTVTVGSTSTLFDMELYTFINVDKFQIETEDEVRTCVSCNINSANYSILFPTAINTEKPFIIHGLDKDGFIILSIPINLKTNI